MTQSYTSYFCCEKNKKIKTHQQSLVNISFSTNTRSTAASDGHPDVANEKLTPLSK